MSGDSRGRGKSGRGAEDLKLGCVHVLKLLHIVLHLLAKALRDVDEARVVGDARLGRRHGVLDGVDARVVSLNRLARGRYALELRLQERHVRRSVNHAAPTVRHNLTSSPKLVLPGAEGQRASALAGSAHARACVRLRAPWKRE